MKPIVALRILAGVGSGVGSVGVWCREFQTVLVDDVTYVGIGTGGGGVESAVLRLNKKKKK